MRAATLIALALLGLGCARVQPRADREVPPAALERERVLAGSGGFEARGRIALSRDGRGGNGHFHWLEAGGRLELVIRAPGAQGALRLRVEGGRACLEGGGEGQRCGRDAERLLARALAARVPLRALSWWLRGARVPGRRSLARFGAAGLPLEIRQSGWTIRYRTWHEALTPPMPRLIEAERGDVRVRIAVASWGRG